jgi:hypothetical protein
MELPPRRYLCACCRTAVIICSHCDRGNRYCGAACATKVRTRCMQKASRDYQCSLPGRHAHAARQRCYRARQTNKVTHQGSPLVALPALLPPDATPPQSDAQPEPEPGQCHFCLRNCGLFVRIGFLRCRFRRPQRVPTQKETQHDRDP